MVKAKLFPKNGSLKRQIKFILNYAILAPSSHNSQPWSFVLTDNTVTLLPYFKHSRPASDPSNRELYISLGALATNISVAASYFGLIFTKTYQTNPRNKQQSILFTFKTGRQISSQSELFSAIATRVTNRYDFQSKPIDKEIVKNLTVTPYSDVKFTPIIKSTDKQKLAKIVYQSGLLWFQKNEFVDELVSWIRSDLSSHVDGLPLQTLPRFKTQSDIVKKAQREALLAQKSPLSIIVSSPRETIRNWIHVGEALEYLLLKINSLGLATAYFNNPVQLVTMLKKLNNTFKLSGLAQLILRIGYPSQTVAPTKRRPLALFIL